MTSFGQWVRATREQLGLIQAAAAKRIGITQARLSRIERQPASRESAIRKIVRGLGAALIVRYDPDGTVTYQGESTHVDSEETSQ